MTHSEATQATVTGTDRAPFFSPLQWGLYALVVTLGLIFRWAFLDMRPYHHDESLHGMYGRYFFDFPNDNYYKYDPMLHGPMLYNTMRFIYSSFGSSNYAARIPVAVFGTIFMLVPFLFRRYFKSPSAVLALTAFIALSPTMVYWSRFLREDYWVFMGMLLMLYGCTLAPKQWASSCVMLGVALNWCTKVNLVVHAVLILGYLLFEYVFRLAFSGNEEGKVRFNVAKFGEVVGVGAAVSVAVIAIAAGWHYIFASSFPEPVSFYINKVYLKAGLVVFGFVFLAALGAARTADDRPALDERIFARVGGAALLAGLLFGLLFWLLIPLKVGDDNTTTELLVFRSFGAGALVAFIGLFGALGAAVRRFDLLIARSTRSVGDFPIHAAVGLLVSFLVYAWFYTAGFRYPLGLFSGVYRGVEYWMRQHSMERIAGPFNFHFYNLSWYESVFILAFLTHIVLFYRRASRNIQFAAAYSVFLLIVARAAIWYFGVEFPKIKVLATLHVKDHLDLTWCWLIVTHALLGTIQHLLRNENRLAFFGYVFFAMFFTYSHLGEKVPWLSNYPFIAGVIYLPFFFERYFHEYTFDYRAFHWRNIFLFSGVLFMVLAFWFIYEDNTQGWTTERVFSWSVWKPLIYQNCIVLGLGALLTACYFVDRTWAVFGTVNLALLLFVASLAYNTRAMVQTNFVFGGKENEYLSQVHTTYDLHEVALRIRKELQNEELGYRPKILVVGEGTWPLTWYFRDLPEYRFSAPDGEKSSFTYIFQDLKEDAPAGYVPEGYTSRKLNLRGWWVPDLNQMTLKKYLTYAFHHTPWSSTGFSTIQFLAAKDVSRFR